MQDKLEGLILDEEKAGEAVEKEKFTRADVYDVVSMLLVAVSVLFSAFRFAPVFTRAWQSLRDLVLSAAYYVTDLMGFKGLITPTVTTIPSDLTAVLPQDWRDFARHAGEYGRLLISSENLSAFGMRLLRGVWGVAKVLIYLLPILALVVWVLSMLYKTPNNDYGHKTVPLRVFEAIENKAYLPVKGFIKGYIAHVRENRLAYKVLLWVWLYNLNMLTIVLEALAFLLYVMRSFDFVSIYTFFVKLVMDLTVPIGFLPWWAYVIVGLVIYDKSRKKIGMLMLWHCEEINRAFLKLYLGALFLVGKQRAKKTTIITDMVLSQEVIFREEAKERLAVRDKQFPFFPWQELERFYWITQENHTLPTLASYRDFLRKLRRWFEGDMHPARGAGMLRLLKKRYGYEWDDFCFGYEWEKHGTEYNDGVRYINVFEAIEAYVQLYYIYAAPTSLIFSNYSIRTDLLWSDYGNFPLFDDNFFSRTPDDVKNNSQRSKNIRFDCFRLYKQMNPQDPYKNGFEVGANAVMEFAKERGNQNTNAGVKAEDGSVNAKNDGFEPNMKIQTHASTIDNYPFFRPFYDDQRADSLSAENKDLCDVCLIQGVSEEKVVMPGFWEKDLCTIATKLHDKIYYKLRHLRGDANGTLLVYLMKKLLDPLYKHCDRVKKQFTVQTAKLRVTDAMRDEVLSKNAKYYICHKKVYSDRFATDGLKQFYHEKALRSKYGLNDFPQFEGREITTREMEESESLFYEKMIKAFLKNEMRGQQNKVKPRKGA